MSTNLFIRPYLKKPDDECLSKALKFALAKRYWEHDGSLSGDKIVFNEKDRAFLEGLIAGSVDHELIQDAEKILKTIAAHGGAILWIE